MNVAQKYSSISTGIQKVARKGFVPFLMRAGSVSAAFFLSIYVSRRFGPEGAGVIFWAITFIGFGASSCQMGLGQFVLRKSADNSDMGKSALNKSTLLVLVHSLALGVLLVLFDRYLVSLFSGEGLTAGFFVLTVPGIACFSLLGLYVSAMQGRGWIGLSMFFQGCSIALVFAFCSFVFPVEDAQLAVGLYSLACLVALIFAAASCRTFATTVRDRSIRWKSLWESVPAFWGISVVSHVVQRAAILISGFFLDFGDVGMLNGAFRLSLLISFLLVAVNTVLAPRFASLHSGGDRAGVEVVAKKGVRMMLLPAIVVMTAYIMFPGEIMSVLGEEFSAGGGLLVILALGQLVDVLAGSVGYLLTMSGNEKDLWFVSKWSGFTALVLPFVLIPLWGAYGAAFACAFTVVFQNLLASWFVKRRLGFYCFKFLKSELSNK